MSHAQKLAIVERFHFGPTVEALIDDKTGDLGRDFDYTLRAFPNHHRALAALSRWWERTGLSQPRGLRRPVECYFDRAVRFRPEDTIVRLLYAEFLKKQQRKFDAIAQVEAALSAAGDHGFTHYNIGMMFLELGETDRALVQAQRAAALGFTRAELRNRLVSSGHWRDVTPTVDSAPASN